MTQHYQNENNPASYDNLAAQELAEFILQNIQEACQPEITNSVADSLQKLLRTKKPKHATTYCHRINQLLLMLKEKMPKEPQWQSASSSIDNSLAAFQVLTRKKEKDLNTWYSYLKFWSDKQWPGMNMLFLIVPLIVGIFIPPIGIAMLIVTCIYTAISVIDFGVQSQSYWQWQDYPGLSIDAQPIDEQPGLEEEHVGLLADTKKSTSTSGRFNKLNAFCYYGDVVAIGICIVGIISLAFPPIGIAELVLLLLAGIAIFIAAVQFGVFIQRKGLERAELQVIENKLQTDPEWIESLNPDALFKQPVIESTSTSQLSLSSTPKPPAKGWMTNWRDWFHPSPHPHPQPTTSSVNPERRQTPKSIFSWINTLMKTQLTTDVEIMRRRHDHPLHDSEGEEEDHPLK